MGLWGAQGVHGVHGVHGVNSGAGAIGLCGACAREVLRVGGARCGRCAREAPGGAGEAPRGAGEAPGGAEAGVCGECRRRPPLYRSLHAAVRFRGVPREVVHRVKYEGRRHLMPLLEQWILEAAQDPRLGEPPVDVWVPVPLHWGRRLWRGYNQAGLLAEAVARRWGGRCGAELRRVRATGTQTRLERGERLVNVQGAMRLSRGARERLRGREVAVVDDVLTTGATVEECCRVLQQAGVRGIRILALARG